MEELKFVWLHGIDEDEEIEKKVVSYLKENKELGKVNFQENDTVYFVAVQADYIENFVDEVKQFGIKPSIETIEKVFIVYFEQCGIELESSLNKRWNIEVTTENILYKLKDEKEIYFNKEIQDKILKGEFEKELYSLAEKMYKDELHFILNDLQTSLTLAKYPNK